MESIHLIRDNLTKSTERVLARIEDMRHHGRTFPTPNGGGHTIWVLGHLAYIEGLVINAFMLGEPNPMAHRELIFDGAEVSSEPAEFPEFNDVLSQCRNMRAATLALLEAHAESDLDRLSAACPAGHEDTFGTRRLCFQYVADHWYMHRGQLADARRSAGLGRMWV
jgi:hypothetical protein